MTDMSLVSRDGDHGYHHTDFPFPLNRNLYSNSHTGTTIVRYEEQDRSTIRAQITCSCIHCSTDEVKKSQMDTAS